MADFTKDNWPGSSNGLPCRPGTSSTRGYIPDTSEMWRVYAEVVEWGLLHYLKQGTRTVAATDDQIKTCPPDTTAVDVLLVFNYPQANESAQKIQEANSQKIKGRGYLAITCPRNPNGNWPAVEMVDLRK